MVQVSKATDIFKFRARHPAGYLTKLQSLYGKKLTLKVEDIESFVSLLINVTDLYTTFLETAEEELPSPILHKHLLSNDEFRKIYYLLKKIKHTNVIHEGPLFLDVKAFVDFVETLAEGLEEENFDNLTKIVDRIFPIINGLLPDEEDWDDGMPYPFTIENVLDKAFMSLLSSKKEPSISSGKKKREEEEEDKEVDNSSDKNHDEGEQAQGAWKRPKIKEELNEIHKRLKRRKEKVLSRIKAEDKVIANTAIEESLTNIPSKAVNRNYDFSDFGYTPSTLGDLSKSLLKYYFGIDETYLYYKTIKRENPVLSSIESNKKVLYVLLDDSGSMTHHRKMIIANYIIEHLYEQLLLDPNLECYLFLYEEDVHRVVNLRKSPSFIFSPIHGDTDIKESLKHAEQIARKNPDIPTMNIHTGKILIICDGQDRVPKTFTPRLKVHSLVMGTHNPYIEKMTYRTNGHYYFIG